MEQNNIKNTLVGDAIDFLGGDSAVAKILNITPWAVAKWRISLPEKRVLWLAKQTGFKYTPHQLDPNMYPNTLDGVPINQKDISHDHIQSVA